MVFVGWLQVELPAVHHVLIGRHAAADMLLLSEA